MSERRPSESDATERPAAVRLRVEPSLAGLAPRVIAGVERRAGRALVLDAPLEAPLDLPAHPPDLGPAVVGLARAGDRVALVSTAPSGARHVSLVGCSAGDEAATARVLVVTLAAFLDDVEADRPRAAPPARAEADTDLRPLDGSALADLAAPMRPPEPVRFVGELRERVSYATQRDTGSAASGLSAGLCVGLWWCALVTADVLAPEERRQEGGRSVSYLSTTLGAGARFLPLAAGPLRGGVGIDATVRVGRLWGAEPAFDTTTASAGLRMQLEAALTLAGPVALVLEAGADIALVAARFVRGPTLVFTEDVLTLWGALALRVGP